MDPLGPQSNSAVGLFYSTLNRDFVHFRPGLTLQEALEALFHDEDEAATPREVLF